MSDKPPPPPRVFSWFSPYSWGSTEPSDKRRPIVLDGGGGHDEDEEQDEAVDERAPNGHDGDGDGDDDDGCCKDPTTQARPRAKRSNGHYSRKAPLPLRTAAEKLESLIEWGLDPNAICSLSSVDYWMTMLDWLSSQPAEKYPSPRVLNYLHALLQMNLAYLTLLEDTSGAAPPAVYDKILDWKERNQVERIQLFLSACLQHIMEQSNGPRRKRLALLRFETADGDDRPALEVVASSEASTTTTTSGAASSAGHATTSAEAVTTNAGGGDATDPFAVFDCSGH